MRHAAAGTGVERDQVGITLAEVFIHVVLEWLTGRPVVTPDYTWACGHPGCKPGFPERIQALSTRFWKMRRIGENTPLSQRPR
jgi:hypothetical protein